jgi:Lysyl oxidase
MHRLGSTRTISRLSAALVAIGLLFPAAAMPVAAAHPSELLPDLRMAPLFGVALQAKHGELRLRFGTLVNNVGDGPLIVRGSRPMNGKMKRLSQLIRQTDNTVRSVAQPDATMYFEPVGVHDHWHVRDFITMRLTALGSTTAPDRLSTKIGFCFYDTTQLPPDERPPNAAPMTFTGCGTQSSRRVRMGISVGWGDAYEPSYQFQAIDVTGIAPGKYRLCATVNPQNVWLEKSDANNSYWMDLRIRPSKKTVTILGEGATPC